MARTIANNGEYFESTSVVVAAEPFTMACWFRANNITAAHFLMAFCVDGSGDNAHRLYAGGNVAGDPVAAESRTTNSISAVSTTGYAASTWQHAAGVWRTDSDRSAYVNGGSRGDNIQTRAPTGMNRTRLTVAGLTTTNPLRGQIAEAAIWNVALTDEEIAALGKGVNPLRIRPLSLVAYWPVYDGSVIPDLRGGYPLTIVGSPAVADHAPVSPPFWSGHGWEGAFTPAAGGASPLLLRLMNEGLYTGMAA